ncbi:uncharacterized protein [Ptychodera flava]|uniref:uncharacterized protein n=1 Tax=Ptychodera flava TaxID=63121 RepID=UPI00396A7469
MQIGLPKRGSECCVPVQRNLRVQASQSTPRQNMSGNDRPPLSPLNGHSAAGLETNAGIVCFEETLDDNDDEIFFGPVTPKEKKKAAKFKRKTELFKPGFRFSEEPCTENEREVLIKHEDEDDVENKENEDKYDGFVDIPHNIRDESYGSTAVIQCMVQQDILSGVLDEEGCRTEEGRATEISPVDMMMREGTMDDSDTVSSDDDVDACNQNCGNTESDSMNEMSLEGCFDAPHSVVQNSKHLLSHEQEIDDTGEILNIVSIPSEKNDADFSDHEVQDQSKIYSVDTVAESDVLDSGEDQHDMHGKPDPSEDLQIQTQSQEISGISTERGLCETSPTEPTCTSTVETTQSQVSVLTGEQERSCVYSSPALTTVTTDSFQNIRIIKQHEGVNSASQLTKDAAVASPLTVTADEVVKKYTDPNRVDSEIENVAKMQLLDRNGTDNCGELQDVGNTTNYLSVIGEAPVMAPTASPTIMTSYDKAKEEMIAQRRLLLAEKRARLAKIRKEREQLMKRMEMDVSKHSKSVADCLALRFSILPANASESLASKLREIELNSLSALTLNETDLDMVTKLHTMKNRNYQMNIDHQNASSQSTGIPSSTSESHRPLQDDITESKTQSRIKWQDSVTVHSNKTYSPDNPAKPGKSILHQRPEGFLYPYSSEVPAAVKVIKDKSDQQTSSTP